MIFSLYRGIGLFQVLARARFENRFELCSIGLRRPDLEAIHFRVDHDTRIVREPPTLARNELATLFLAEVSQRGQKQLERGQPLLPVDHLPLG
jgi:hypothetical protein